MQWQIESTQNENIATPRAPAWPLELWLSQPSDQRCETGLIRIRVSTKRNGFLSVTVFRPVADFVKSGRRLFEKW